MRAAFPDLIAWMATDISHRYVILVGHPGMGTIGMRVRLFEAIPTPGGGQEMHSVTEDGPIDAVHDTVAATLARWAAGTYDTVTVPTLRSLIGDGL